VNNGRIHTPTVEMIDFIKNQLTNLGFSVLYFPSPKDIEEIFTYIPTARLPSAVVSYSGSSYAEDPNRTAVFTILVTTRYDVNSEVAVVQYLQMLDSICASLDYQVSGDVKYTIVSDEAMRIDKHSLTCSILLKVKAEDY